MAGGQAPGGHAGQLLRVEGIAAASLQETSDLVHESIVGMRNFIAGLRPAELEYGGLSQAIRAEADRVVRRFGLAVQLDIEGYRSSAPQQTETTIFRVVQEALTNVARHAAASRVSVAVHENSNTLTVDVSDDGPGLPPGDVETLFRWGCAATQMVEGLVIADQMESASAAVMQKKVDQAQLKELHIRVVEPPV